MDGHIGIKAILRMFYARPIVIPFPWRVRERRLPPRYRGWGHPKGSIRIRVFRLYNRHVRRLSLITLCIGLVLSCGGEGEGESPVHKTLLPFESDSGWGAMDTDGGVVFFIKGAKHLGWFSEGLAPFSPDGLTYGYVDTSGRVVIPARFRVAGEFRDGMAVVEETRWGVIDKSGRYLLKPEYLAVTPAGYGLFWVRLGNAWRLIDTTGKFIGDHYVHVYPFNRQGWARVRTSEGWGVMDTAGKWIVEPGYTVVDTAIGGVFLVRDTTGWGYVKDGKVVYWRKVRRLSLDSLKVVPEVKIKLPPPNLK